MTEEEQVPEEAVSEPDQVEPQEGAQEEAKMVPLAAMLATRKKSQEMEQRALKAEAQAQLYQEYLMQAKQEEQPAEEEEDPTAPVEKKELKQHAATTKRDILETLYQDMNPEAVQKINKYLKPILEKKPWLAASVQSAQNRYARANEIVNDYLHLVEEKPPVVRQAASDAKRIVQNAQKPGSPVATGKSAQPSGAEYLKSIQGTKEFREYRKQMVRR